MTEENDEDGIWSILTDNLHYLEVKSSFDSNPIKFQTPDIERFPATAKKRFFNADNNNIPLQEIEEEKQQLKFDREFQTNEFERDQQYENINAVIDENFNPNSILLLLTCGPTKVEDFKNQRLQQQKHLGFQKEVSISLPKERQQDIY